MIVKNLVNDVEACASLFGSVYVLIGFAVVLLIVDIELLVVFNLYSFSTEIVRIKNNIRIIVGCFYLFQCVFLVIGIYTYHLV